MKHLKIGDICLLLGIPLMAVLLAVCFFLISAQGDVAVVQIDNIQVCRLPLAQDTQVTLPDSHHVIVVEEGQVYVKSAPCHDQICARTPAISHVGQSIVCLPYHLVVSVEEGGA